MYPYPYQLPHPRSYSHQRPYFYPYSHPCPCFLSIPTTVFIFMPIQQYEVVHRGEVAPRTYTLKSTHVAYDDRFSFQALVLKTSKNADILRRSKERIIPQTRGSDSVAPVHGLIETTSTRVVKETQLQTSCDFVRRVLHSHAVDQTTDGCLYFSHHHVRSLGIILKYSSTKARRQATSKCKQNKQLEAPRAPRTSWYPQRRSTSACP